MKLPAQHESPRFAQSLLWVRGTTQPCSGNRGALSGVSQHFILAVPTLVLRFRRQRAGGMICELQIALEVRQLARFTGCEDIEKHLVSLGGDNVHRTIANLDRSAVGLNGLLDI